MLSVAIQAGGRSTRMGRDKALVPLGGRPLIEHVLERVRGLGDEVLITTNNPQSLSYLGLPLVGDDHPGAGALYGLLTALTHARGERVLVVGCDMPFLQRALLDHLVRLSQAYQAVVPFVQGNYEPLLAVYAKSALPAIRGALDAGQRRVISFFPHIHLRTVTEEELDALDPEGLSFFNVNTPGDLKQAEILLRAQRPSGGASGRPQANERCN
jgi:molybdopterin-guanine dinucleotide biosynthesis protein A